MSFKRESAKMKIMLTASLAQTPYYNELIERINKTLLDEMQGVLQHGSSRNRFWSDTPVYATEVHNRNAKRALKRINPMKALLRTEPNIEKRQLFGHSAFAHAYKT